MYYKKEGKAYLIYKHDIDNKSLPFDGWLHNCIFCDAICGSMIDFSHDEHSIKLLCCKDCKYSNKINLERDKINYWIDINIPKCFSKFFCNCK